MKRVEDQPGIGIGADREIDDDVDVELVALGDAGDRRTDGHRALRVKQGDEAAKGAALPVDPVLHGLEAAFGLVVVGLRKLDPDRDVGEQNVR